MCLLIRSSVVSEISVPASDQVRKAGSLDVKSRISSKTSPPRST